MSEGNRKHVDDLRGMSKLAIEATKGVTALVQEMHVAIGGTAARGLAVARPKRAR